MPNLTNHFGKFGQVIKIFRDPITGKKLEGEAKLLSLHQPDNGDGLSYWAVEFLDEPGQTYFRFVNEANA